ncbi:putative stomatin-like protein 1 [Apostichopus japonicus]|uniref:Putative stomatin-like protein 1 n=1 Tax=Stichopus japonicus TaxID=307972 RepID=A0A2G8KS43_STIJA|nr:putative stomatin-like protein 1 [Apostichopus japonicus]
MNTDPIRSDFIVITLTVTDPQDNLQLQLNPSRLTSSMSQVKYNRLSSADSGLEDSAFAIDFKSPFSYKSVYTYSKSAAPYIGEERDYKPSVLTLVCTWTVIIISHLILLVTFPISGWFAVKGRNPKAVSWRRLSFSQASFEYFRSSEGEIKTSAREGVRSIGKKM